MLKTIGAAAAAAMCLQVIAVPTAQALPLAGGGQAAVGCVPQSFTPKPNSSGSDIVAEPSKAALQTEMLAMHNAERKLVSIPALTWDDQLANAAQTWATHLISRAADATTPRYGLVHDKAAENLAGGESGASFTATELARAWIYEKPAYKDGKFPDVSITCNARAVGHYTQIVWLDTTRVGCGIASDNRARILACRYAPAGNIEGQRVLVSNAPPPEPPFLATMLATNNQVRSALSVPVLAWDDMLAQGAVAEADKRINETAPGARPLGGGETYGFGWNTGDAPIYPTAGPLLVGSLATGSWQRGVAGSNSWTKVGCGTVTKRIGNENRRVVMCHYA